ncbi:MAG: hypothetical protein IRZ18_01335 [Clostridia bacterium]|nr:hypothetical protein [Clostridia bacterium]
MKDEEVPQDGDRIEERIGRWLREREMEVPAILAAETMKPVAWMLAQGVHFFTPHLDILSYLHGALRERNVQALAGFLEDPQRLEAFIRSMEDSARRRGSGRLPRPDGADGDDRPR